jgi:hypothetical protein
MQALLRAIIHSAPIMLLVPQGVLDVLGVSGDDVTGVLNHLWFAHHNPGHGLINPHAVVSVPMSGAQLSDLLKHSPVLGGVFECFASYNRQ